MSFVEPAMTSPCIIGLRSVALEVPDLVEAERFYTEVWHLSVAACSSDTLYLRGSGPDHHLLALHQGTGVPRVRKVTLRACSAGALRQIEAATLANGGRVLQPPSATTEPSGGEAMLLCDPTGRVFEVVHDDLLHAVLPDTWDHPLRLTHVVLNAAQIDAAQCFLENVFGFRRVDRTRIMAFMNCNSDHHTIALGDTDNDALNHIAFLMPTLDAVMRGGGRMRDAGHAVHWGPGRHGPGDNAFNYFIDPFGIVIEYTAEVEQVDEHYRVGSPEDWGWPVGRTDQWGIGVAPSAALRQAQRTVLFAPD